MRERKAKKCQTDLKKNSFFFADVKIVIEFYLRKTHQLAALQSVCGICYDVRCVNDVCVYMVESEMKVYRKS